MSLTVHLAVFYSLMHTHKVARSGKVVNAKLRSDTSLRYGVIRWIDLI